MAARDSVLHQIAERRASDLATELGDRTLRDLVARAGEGPRRREVAGRFARAGLHLIAEIKRSSPSAGSMVDGDLDVAERARAYQAGGASMISVLVEPHWFGGSIEDLQVARAATTLPVLAKEFVVDPRQLPLLRAAGADAVLLLAALHPPKRLAALVRTALDVGLEPLVEAHTGKELVAALSTDARLVGINNRDLKTLEVDTKRCEDLRSLRRRGPHRHRRIRRPRRGHRPPLARARVRRCARRRGPHALGLGPGRGRGARVGAGGRRFGARTGRRSRGRWPRAVRQDLRDHRAGRPRCGHRRRRRRDRPELRARHAAGPRRRRGGRAGRLGSSVGCAGERAAAGRRLRRPRSVRGGSHRGSLRPRCGAAQRRRARQRSRRHPAAGAQDPAYPRRRRSCPKHRRDRGAGCGLRGQVQPAGHPARHLRSRAQGRDRPSRLGRGRAGDRGPGAGRARGRAHRRQRG